MAQRHLSTQTPRPDPGVDSVPFIVGCARSGTTLLRLMLDAHPDLAIPPETHFLPIVFQLTSEGRKLREEFFEVIVRGPRWADFHLGERGFEERLEAVEPFNLTQGLQAFYRMYAEAQKKRLWGDKTPGYILHLRRIVAVLPKVRFIHLVRDGRDVAASLRKLWWGPGDNIEAQAVDWLRRIREARRQAQDCPHYLEIRYEDLVSDPRTTLQRICGFLELPYAEAMLGYPARAAERLDEFSACKISDGSVEISKEQILKIHERTVLPPNREQIQRWRRDLSAEETQCFQSIAGDLLREFGYEIAEPGCGPGSHKLKAEEVVPILRTTGRHQ